MIFIDNRIPKLPSVSDPTVQRWIKDVTKTLTAIMPALTALCARAALPYTFVQASPETVWTMPHGLGVYPVAAFHDASGNPLAPTVTNPDLNTTVATFGAPTAGTARLI